MTDTKTKAKRRSRKPVRRERKDGRTVLRNGDERLVPLTKSYYYLTRAGGRSWSTQHLFEPGKMGYNVSVYADAGYFLFTTKLEPQAAAKHVAKAVEAALKKHGRPLAFREALANISTISVRRPRA